MFKKTISSSTPYSKHTLYLILSSFRNHHSLFFDLSQAFLIVRGKN